tara:strand:+ start:375 stop:578 length:204 start_codon:yes stop_codon:yes gene_type:complete
VAEELAEVNTDLTTLTVLDHQEVVDTEHQTKVVEKVELVKLITEQAVEEMDNFLLAVMVVTAAVEEF